MRHHWGGFGLGLLLAAFTWKMGLAQGVPSKLYLTCQIAPERREAQTSCLDVSDILPNASTAYAVGMAILKERYGAKALKYPEPYEARFNSIRDEWCVDRAQFAPGDARKGRLPRKGGGNPYVCLSKKNGRVTFIGLSV